MRDFFISFTQVDRPWATWVAWLLEEAGYSVYFQDWDFHGNFVEQINRAHAGARRTIAILSENYLHSDFASVEWTARFEQDPGGHENRLVLIKVGSTETATILRTRLHVDLTGCNEDEAKARLLDHIKFSISPRKRAKPSSSPVFPGSPDASQRLANKPDFPPDAGIVRPAATTRSRILREPQLIDTLRGHSDIIFRISWSYAEPILASPSKDKTIRLWKIGDRKYDKILGELSREPNCVSWDPQGNFIACASDGGACTIWDLQDGVTDELPERHKGDVNCIAISSDGKFIASGSDGGEIFIWHLTGGHRVYSVKGHQHWVTGLAWAARGGMVASCSRDKSVCIWNAQSGKLAHRLIGHSQAVYGVAWSPDGRMLASASSDGTVRFWDVSTGKNLGINSEHNAEVTSVSYSNDGSLVATKSFDDTVIVMRASNNELLCRISEVSSKYSYPSLAFHPRLPLLATMGEEDTVLRVWDFREVSGGR